MILASRGYAQLPSFPLNAYWRYCSDHAAACLDAGSYGGKWSNASCEAQCGVASRPRCLCGNGAPRWKQRAFYDFIKDLSPLLIGVSVVRIAIWDLVADEMGTRAVKDVLIAPSKGSSTALAVLIRERAGV